jgi:hypothetical protein
MADKPEVISTVKARGGVTPHIVRYVLIASTVLAVIAMGWALLAAPDEAPADVVPAQAQQQ